MPKAPTIFDLVAGQGRRIAKLEREVAVLKGAAPLKKQEVHEKEGPAFELPNISFTAFVTTAGIIGVIIGLISFFMYAIANKWIGPTGQVLIGVVVGLVLFALGYTLYEKHPGWSITVFGGAIFVEYLCIGYGVWVLKLIPPGVAFAGLVFFLVLGLLISLKYDSRFIAYCSMIGGFLVPVLAHLGSYPLLIFCFLLALALGVFVLSFSKDWADIRLVSFLFVTSYGLWGYVPFGSVVTGGLDPVQSCVFIAAFFLVYNLATVAFSVRTLGTIKGVDIVTLSLNTFMTAWLVWLVCGDPGVISHRLLGGIYMALAFLLLWEAFAVKNHGKSLLPTAYAVLTSAIILMNIGIVLVFSTGNPLRLVLLVLPQWALFNYLSHKTKDGAFYAVFSYVFLGLAVIWWLFSMWMPSALADATIVIVGMLAFLGFLYAFIRARMGATFCGIVLLLLGYIVWYSLLGYVDLLYYLSTGLALSDKVLAATLSGIWLVYTLLVFVKARAAKHDAVKVIAFTLLIITLMKIAFWDILLLTGVVRIIGFTVFGILLLIGGLLLRNE